MEDGKTLSWHSHRGPANRLDYLNNCAPACGHQQQAEFL